MSYVHVVERTDEGYDHDGGFDLSVGLDLSGVVPIIGDRLFLPDEADHYYLVVERWLYPWTSECAAVLAVEVCGFEGDRSFLP